MAKGHLIIVTLVEIEESKRLAQDPREVVIDSCWDGISLERSVQRDEDANNYDVIYTAASHVLRQSQPDL